MSFKIVQKENPNALHAAGFWTRERAEAWLARYDRLMWDDKTVTADDLEIVEETPFSERKRK